MTIAVNAVTAGLPNNDTSFLLNHVKQLVQLHPQHQFLIISTAAFAEAGNTQNIALIKVKHQFTTPLRLQFWLRFSLPGILKKNGASLLLHTNFCMLKNNLPQVLFIDDVSFYKHPEWYKKTWLQFYKKNMPAFATKATAIVTASASVKNELVEAVPTSAEKVTVQPAPISSMFSPAIHWQQKETVKEKFTAGKEYFLYCGLIATNKNLITLLKAFTLFKQRQKSNMQLVLLSAQAAEKKFLTTLSSYKYKTEVLVAENCGITEHVTISAAAYAVMLPSLYDGNGAVVMQSIYSGVPVIATHQSNLHHGFDDAVLYCDATNVTDMAEKMMMIFKNEDERNNLIAKGRELKAKLQKQTAYQDDLLQKWANT